MKVEWYKVIKTGLLLLLVSMIFIIGLEGLTKNGRINEILSDSDKGKNDVSGNAVVNSGKRNHKRIVRLMETSYEEAWVYWSDVLKDDKEKEELEYIVHWMKDKHYLQGLWIDERGVDTLPENNKTRRRVQEEDGFDRVKEYMKRTKYSVVNHGSSENRVAIMHEFQLEEIQGNYCLEYLGGKLSKNEKENYKKVEERFYSYVIYYK